MSIESDLHAVAEAVRVRLPELVATLEVEFTDQIPEIRSKDDPAVAEAETDSIVSAVTSIVDGLSSGRRPPERAPDAALREARIVAQAGIDLHSLLRTYRLGQSTMWNFILEEAVRLIDSDERRVAVLKQASDYHFAWNDKVMASVIEAYQLEYTAYFLRSQDRKRRAAVSDILRGLPADIERLDYNLRTSHLAVVAWGRSAEANISSLAVALGAQLLMVSGTSDTRLGWFGAASLAGDLDDTFKAISAMPDTCLAMGEVGRGVEGFRLSHRQAWQAYRISRLRPGKVIRYRDVALEALVLRDHQAARDFIERELGALQEDGKRSDVLLSTLTAYFESGQNAAATAQSIFVHERTVAYRLRSIEAKLGLTIASRRDELAVAMRLSSLLDAYVGSDDRGPIQIGPEVGEIAL